MKLRIKGNSVRLRLLKTEVDLFPHTLYIEERTDITGNIFKYALQCVDGTDRMTAEFKDNKLTVFIPLSFVKDWPKNDVVGFESENNGLHILVEKDFKCLEDTREDQTDNFENPNKSC